MVLGSRLVAVTWTCFCYPWQQIRGNVCTSFSKVQLMEVCNIRSILSWVLYVCLTHSSPVLYFSGLFYRPKHGFYVTQTNDWFLCDLNKWLVSVWPKQMTGFSVAQTNDWFLCEMQHWSQIGIIPSHYGLDILSFYSQCRWKKPSVSYEF